MAACFIPVDLDSAAIHDNAVASRPKPASHNGHPDGAGTTATGHGDPDAAFPDTHPEGRLVDPADNREIDPVRKQRGMFRKRPKTWQINRLGIIDKDNGMRVAKRMTDGIAKTFNTERHTQRIDLIRQRHVTPAGRHRTHINGYLAAVGIPGAKPATTGFDAEVLTPGLPHHIIGNTARAVSAGP